MDENRVYKFRCFIKGKGMYYFTIDELIRDTVHSDSMTFSGGGMSNWVWNDGVKMQYAGLKDKNGKEIYEGDIVKFLLPNEHEGETEYIEEVQYEGSCFYLDGNVPVDAFASELEIIGNIYENETLINK